MVAKSKPAPRAKPFSVRLDEIERKALAKASLRDDRPAAVIVRRVVREWLRAEGFLK